MSVYTNQTNASPGDAFFAAAGSAGGTPSNWSQYPAISTITYSGAGGIANFTTLNALTAVSTPNLLVSTINNTIYPPAGGVTPIVGTIPIPEGSNAITPEIIGVTGSSIITGTFTTSDATVTISSLTPGSNEITLVLTSNAPSASRFNYAIFPAAT
jgi:hypothetical protein